MKSYLVLVLVGLLSSVSAERKIEYGGWGYGGYGQNGCSGSTCGYWDGCQDKPEEKCTGYYDFKNCDKDTCTDKKYTGYDCYQAHCLYICKKDVCRMSYEYGLGCQNDNCGQPLTYIWQTLYYFWWQCYTWFYHC